MTRRSSPRRSASASCAPRTRRRTEGVHGEAGAELAVPMTAFETILLDVDAASHVATITLNRPDSLNAFNRTMCEEMADVWRTVKLDESVNAVVLRAAGDRAFSAGLDIKTPYGQPDNVWNHEDPGEALSPKWQKMWKPVVCAVQGMCTAGAFYFVNESDVVICSDDATFFDSHVSAGLVCALEPVGLMRRVGLGETLRIALMGNDERVGADTALRIGLVSEVVSPRSALGACARDRGGHRCQTTVGDTGHGEGDLGVAGQALPCGDGAEPDLHPARKPARASRTRRPGHGGAPPEGALRRHPLSQAHRRRARAAARRCSDRVRRPVVDVAAGRRPSESDRRRWARPRSGCCCATDPPTWRPCSACCSAAAPSSPSTPPAATTAPARTSPRWTCQSIVGEPDDLASVVPDGPTAIPISGLDAAPQVPAPGAGRPGVAVRMLTSGTTGPPKRIDLTYDMLARSVIGATDAARPKCGGASRSSTPRWCTSAGCSACCSVSARHGRSCCWTASS